MSHFLHFIPTELSASQTPKQESRTLGDQAILLGAHDKI